MSTKTIFRKFRNGEVVAIFPEVPHTRDGWQCVCYAHLGQHGSFDPFCVRVTKPATPAEYAPLARELKRIGYKLDIIKRFPANAYHTRKKAAAV